MKKIQMLLIASIAIALSLSLIASANAINEAPNAHPEGYAGFVVEPMLEKLELTAGELYSGYFTIRNTTNADLNIEVAIEPLTWIDSGAMIDTQTMTSRTEIVYWTNLTNSISSNIEIQAGESRVVSYIIDVPMDVGAEEQMELITLRPTTPNEYGYINSISFRILATITKQTESLNVLLILLCLIMCILIVLLIICIYMAFFRKRHNKKH